MPRTPYERNKKYLFMKKYGVTSLEYEEMFYPEGQRVNVYNFKKPLTRLEINRKHKYGLSNEDFLKMANAQDGKCAACGSHQTKVLEVDHNHVTGKVRGLLCRKCNSKLGWLEKDQGNVILLKYLFKYDDMTKW